MTKSHISVGWTLAVLVGMFAVAAQAQVPSGYASFNHQRTGLRFYYPKKFKPVPVQPTELLTIARFTRSSPYLAKKGEFGRYPETIEVFVLKDKTTPAGGATVDPKKPITSYEESVARRNQISFYKEYMKSRHRGTELDKRDVKTKSGVQEFDLSGQRSRRPGFLYVRQGKGFSYGVVGYADRAVFPQMIKRFRKVGGSIHKPTGYSRVKDGSDTFYKNKKFRDVAFRVEARKNMVKGWKPLDTKNFFIVYHTKNTKMVKKVANDLEAIRPLYMDHFPPVAPIEAVSVVRICQDIDEYHKYGGRPGTAGYWNFVAKELVLYDFTKIPKSARKNARKRKASDSYIVLYHEAFHQYIYYAAGQMSPHYWFNEGLGDYFSGTTIYRGSKKIKGVDLNRWRLPMVKSQVDKGRFVNLETLLNAKRDLYYNPKQAGLMYAEGWSICYFLLKSKEAKGEQQWQQIIPKYFDALKAGYKKHVDGLGDGAALAAKQVGAGKAREAALETALKGIDIARLEKAWKSWIRNTKDPWAAQRERERARR